MKSIVVGVFASVRRNIFTLLMLGLLAACGGGGTPPDDTPTPYDVDGGGVKGPLANAIITAYALDTTQADFKGAVVDTGTTDNSAQITGLALPVPLTPPYILEFTSDAGTTDITTGQAPVITILRTVLTQALLNTGEQVYATPLTTMATDIAIANADNGAPYAGDSDGTTTTQEFLDALPIAAAQVLSTFGFGATSIDIWDTPPLIDATTDTTAEQTAVAAYRTAIEALTALAFEMGQNSALPAVSAEAMFADLTADLADGVVDGTPASSVNAAVLAAITTTNPATLTIPNTSPAITVGDVEQLLADEKAITGSTTPTPDLEDGTTIVITPQPANPVPDTDGDTVRDDTDNCPYTANQNQNDGNGNNVGDVCDSPPVANNDSITVDEGGTATALDDGATNVLDNDTDTEGDTFTATIITGPNNAASFTLNTDGTFSYTHDGSETPTTDSFTYIANDGTSNSNTATVSITINPQNDPPVAVADSASVPVGGTVTLLTGGATNVLANDTDVESDPLTAVLDTNVINGSLTLNADGTFSYTHNGGGSSSDSFSYYANDGTDDSNIVTVSITITANAAPVANNDGITTDEGGTATVLNGGATSVLVNDTDADPLTAVLDTGPSFASGFVLNTDGTFSYTHDGSETAADSFTYHANDGTSNSNIATVTITINPQNDVPVAVIETATVNEGGTVTVLDGGAASVLVNDTDAEGDPLTAVMDTDASNGSLTLNSDGTFSYTHDGSETTSDSFGYHANDGAANSSIVTVNISVTAVDDPTVLSADTNSVAENVVPGTATGNVLSNDVDPDTVLTVSNAAALEGTGAYGSLTINGTTGAYTYTLDNGNAAVDALNTGDSLTEIYGYDANGQSSTLTITINGADDATSLAADTASITEDAAPNTISGNVLSNDTDPDTVLTVSNAAALEGTGTYGSLTINGTTGAYTYTLDNGNAAVDALNSGDTLTETYNYDANGQTTTLTITINGASDATGTGIVGTWGFGRLKHRNSGTWAARSGTFIYNADGTGSRTWQENDNNILSSGTNTWTWSANTNPDGSITITRTFSDSSISTQRVAISDDNMVMILDGADNPNQQRYWVAVRMDPTKIYTNADLSGDYYGTDYNASWWGAGFDYVAGAGTVTSDAAGSFNATVTNNLNGTIGTSSFSEIYTINADGSMNFGGGETGYLTGDGKLVVSTQSTAPMLWDVLFLMEKADRVYSTADLAGTWAYMSFQDNDNGASYASAFGTMNCDNVGNCTANAKFNRGGTITVETDDPPFTFVVQPDGSFGVSLGGSTPDYAAAIGNDGNVIMVNPSLDNIDTTVRRTIIGVRCSTCTELATGGGPGLTQLTFDPASDLPDWNAAGTRIVFRSTRSGNNDIWIMDADGGNQTQLTNTPENEGHPHFSSDGSQIVFWSERTGDREVWSMNSDGSGQTQITNNTADDGGGAWSPDGTQIVFRSDRAGNNDVWLMDADGTNLIQLTTNTASDRAPQFSPDGTNIVFWSFRTGNGDIWIMNADGSNPIQLTTNLASDSQPHFSADSTQIVFHSNRSGNNDVWVMNSNGTGQTRVTTLSSDDSRGDFSPDGTQIVFQSDRSGNQEIWTYTFPLVITGTITLPASVTNQEWFVGIDTDLDGDNGMNAYQRGTVTGNSFNYAINLPTSGDFYVFAEVNVSGVLLGPWETGDYVGDACGDRLIGTACTVNISADSTFDFNLSVMP